jgi:inner membrane protein
MDSLTQFALGSAVGVAVMGRRTRVWKAALWGGLCGTLPDLDSFVDHGDPIRNMTFHRAESHALFYLTLASPLLASGIAKVHGEMGAVRRWWLAVWLVLVTHPLLDVMTVYGTQLALPFTDYPFGVGSIFIIDPLYTLPIMLGVLAALAVRTPAGLRWNTAGLALSTAYLAWSFVAQQHVERVAHVSLRTLGIEAERVLVTPSPFNTILWRVVAVTPQDYCEGFRSLLDDDRPIDFTCYGRNPALYAALRDDWSVARIAWFSHGLFKMSEHDGIVRIADIRMGLEPHYTFTFEVARRTGSGLKPMQAALVANRADVRRALGWIWQRMWGRRPAFPTPAAE